MKTQYKVLDTFAGAGGFSLGLEMTNQAEIIGAIEIDQWASETFKFNHKNTKVLTNDITKLSNYDLQIEFKEKPNIILGGPPCQGFSICNINNGDPKDPRNSLFKEFIRLGKLFEPEVLIMENVPNLINAKTSNNEKVIDIITKEFEKIGYNVYSKILSASDYGIPQIRKRLFIIASKKILLTPFPTPTHTTNNNSLNLIKCPTLWDAISDLNTLKAREGAEELEYEKEPINDYQKWCRINSKKLYNHKAMNHTKRVVERFASMSWGDSVSDVPEHLKPLKRNGNGIISSKTYDQNNRRMHPHKQCHTITASFYSNFVHPFSNRNFTAREGARIQSFPDNYIFKGKPTVVSQKLLAREGRLNEKFLGQYNQIGNAVPPLLAKAIANNLFKQLKGE